MIELAGGEFYWVTFIFVAVFIGLSILAKKLSKGAQKDKIAHAGISFVLTVLLSAVMKSVIIGSVITLGIGVGKEVWDYFSKKGTADHKDFIADAIGVAFGAIIMITTFWAASVG